MADYRKDWRKSEIAFCLRVATHKFHNVSLRRWHWRLGPWQQSDNNLRLNRTKSVKLVFVPPRRKRAIVIPRQLFLDSRASSWSRLSEWRSISWRFSVAQVQHVDATQAGRAQTFALRTLQQHGMPNCALRTFFQATVVNKFFACIVRKLTINYSITFSRKAIIHFVRCFHQKGVNNTLSVVAVITCSFQSALPPSKTITL